MEKKFFSVIKILLFNFIVIFVKLNSTSYPVNDYPVGIYTNPLTVYGGDGIGSQGHSEAPVPQGLAWLSGGLTVLAGGAGNYVDVCTPLPLNGEIGLINGGSDYPVLVSDLFLSNNVTLTVGGECQTKYGRFVLNGEFDLSDQLLTLQYWPGKINGNGNVLNFSNGGQILQNGNFMEFENVYLKGIQAESIRFTNRTENLILKNCIIELDGNFVLDADLEIDGEVLVTGVGHTLCINRYLIINEGSRLTFDIGTTFSMGYPACIAEATNGIIHFNGCNIEIGDNYGLSVNINNGFYMRRGLVVFENRVRINDDGNYKNFIVGEDCDLKILASGNVILDGTTTFSVL